MHMGMRRVAAIAFFVWVSCALAACNGRLVFQLRDCDDVVCPSGEVCSGGECIVPTNPCDAIDCGEGNTCLAGQCIPGSTLPCSPEVQNGVCPEGQVCASGTCFDQGTEPPACAPGVNGRCPEGQACVEGACVAISAPCSSENMTGACPGGQVCVLGTCFVDDGIACSAARPDGFCGPGQSCLAGVCTAVVETCAIDNPTGTCAGWQACIGGACVGPIVPDACSPTLPTGRCPTDEVCVAGTCTPIVDDNVCSAAHPTGLCAAGAGCLAGTCVAIDVGNGCSAALPAGLCSGGAICQGGACVTNNCSSGGWACPSGQWCISGGCGSLPCSPTNPSGLCADALQACVSGACITPPCSIEYPFGECTGGLVCDDGVCIDGPCAVTNTDGYCTGTSTTCHPTLGCGFTMPSTCCDPSLAGATGCTVGTCAAPVCSAAVPHGDCPSGQYCDAGTCVPGACSPYFIEGSCPGANEVCVYGRCAKTGCADEPDPNAYCAPLQCDLGRDQCIAGPCTPSNPTGACGIGLACCSQAMVDGGLCSLGGCFAPPCMAQFPGGACPGGEACAGGNCVPLPCSATNQDGACGPNYGCELGVCKIQVCSLASPGGSCPSGDRCVAGVCEPYVCGVDFPGGPCPIGQVCTDVAGTPTCLTPACSAQYPGGSCGAGLICVGGSCIPQPCSTTYPTGACGAGFTCVGGFCQPAACSATVTNGVCTGVDAGKVCVGGVCEVYACGASFPTGPCPSGQVCTAGSPPSCLVPPCSNTYPGGSCSSGQVCASTAGGQACVTPACGVSSPTGACPSSQTCCNAGNQAAYGCTVGTCTLDFCSASATDGRCGAGKVCCDAGLITSGYCDGVTTDGTPGDGGAGELLGDCANVVCSSEFPLGACSTSGEFCQGGVCVEVCSLTNELGWCPTGFACVEAACSFSCPSDADCDDIADDDENIATCSVETDEIVCGGVSGCVWLSGAGCVLDTDGDGSPDRIDRDSDGDLIPDSAEAGDRQTATDPVDSDNDGVPDVRDLDSDGDHMEDTYEAGPAPAVPRDTDQDGTDDYQDDDSDGDGILDRCEVAGALVAGACTATGVVPSGSVLDTDGDGTPDYRDRDSDDDGTSDAVEARTRPAVVGTLVDLGVDHDGDTTPDYRDGDSDNDGVLDAEEDTNGDGVVNCQLTGAGATIPDTRVFPACDETTAPFSVGAPYNYNPGCPTQKCLLGETSRVHTDTDGDGIPDGQDGIFLSCSVNNLKPINLFYSQPADYALALETRYTSTHVLQRSGVDTGMTFDDPDSAFNDGSYAVSGFVLSRAPSASAMAASDPDPARNLIVKALAQETADRALLAGATGVTGVSQVISRNFTSFDGYGVVVSRYNVTSASISTAVIRDRLGDALDAPVTGYAGTAGGPTSTSFTLVTQTLYRYDNGSTGRVVVVGAVAPASSPEDQSYAYRGSCVVAVPPVPVTFIANGATWDYFSYWAAPTNDAQGDTWIEGDYALTSRTSTDCLGGTCPWRSGAAGIGFNNGANTTQVADNNQNDGGGTDYPQTYYLRRTFTVTAPLPQSLTLTVDYDDGFAAYLNGVEVARYNLDAGDTYTSRANGTRDNGTPVVLALNPSDLLVGTNVLAIEVHDRTDQTPPTAAGDAVMIPSLTGTVAGSASCPAGCTGSPCVPRSDYQLPLFFADNIANGSAVAQYGDDLGALCQALVQDNGEIDFLWAIDNSGSMQEEITQVATASRLFFDLFNNTEADYRVAQTTSATSSTNARGWYRRFAFQDDTPRVNGILVGDFTGAIAGQVNPSASDRTVTYACSEGCFNQLSCDIACSANGDETSCEATLGCDWSATSSLCVCEPCCSACGAGTVQDPACYFASRLPDDYGTGSEFTVHAAELAVYRAGAAVRCPSAATASACAALPGCSWNGTSGVCMAGYCVAPPASVGGAYTADECNGNDTTGALQVPAGSDDLEDEYEPTGCAWNPGAPGGASCWPSMGMQCSNATTQTQCDGSTCGANLTQAACTSAGCNWYSSVPPGACRSATCAAFTGQTNCEGNPGCIWHNPPSACGQHISAKACVDAGCDWFDAVAPPECRAVACAAFDGNQSNCNNSSLCVWRDPGAGLAGEERCIDEDANARCLDRPNASMCDWDGAACVPSLTAGSTLCSASTQAECISTGAGFCQWDSGTSTCSAPPKRAFRAGAHRFVVLFSDEEDCYMKDADFEGNCSGYYDSSQVLPYSGTSTGAKIRLTRADAYAQFYESRGFTVFAVAGDKADPGQAVDVYNNGGCATAEPGNGHIDVAEATGGGWGSICAIDLYPTIEAIVIGAVGKASPYVLEGFIDGQAVQPIAATIKVSVEVCKVPAEYPTCATSGTEMQSVPRSREDGFDYDAINNTLILYGDARPVLDGDIVVSYRYWIDNEQPPAGNPSCPCPETSAPGCACPTGTACGQVGATNNCTSKVAQGTCELTPGCSWNDVIGCVVNGACEADPTCGGACGVGTTCDPETGLCVCDPTCGGACGAGEQCDDNRTCDGLDASTCAATSGCAFNVSRALCLSVTCGQCLCDTTCGGGCAAGQTCDGDTGSPTCGVCACDTTCGGGCPANQTCNSDTGSPGCGFCQPPECGTGCPTGFVCDPNTGFCVCDATCGGGSCPAGRTCDGDANSTTCGQCLCDTTCGGSCPTGQTCDSDTGSGTCGLCRADPTCGGACNPSCDTLTTQGACTANVECRWASWLNAGAGACTPIACSTCNPLVGLCLVDDTCCGACGPTEACNASTGECECDTNCGFACAPGLTCDGSTASTTCGLCLCDTTCGGTPCPQGQVCDDNGACDGFVDESSCNGASAAGCSWDPATSACLSFACGRCVIDPTCGGCDVGETCNPVTGLCQPVCPDCPSSQICDPVQGICVCDQTCGGVAAPPGLTCDGNLASPTCGKFICDPTCGGACPVGQLCDTGATCEALSTSGNPSACAQNATCVIDADLSECFSPTCGLCIIDPTCGGACGAGTVCDPLTGLCVPDPDCGGCPSGMICNPVTLQCVPIDG